MPISYAGVSEIRWLRRPCYPYLSEEIIIHHRLPIEYKVQKKKSKPPRSFCYSGYTVEYIICQFLILDLLLPIGISLNKSPNLSKPPLLILQNEDISMLISQGCCEDKMGKIFMREICKLWPKKYAHLKIYYRFKTS